MCSLRSKNTVRTIKQCLIFWHKYAKISCVTFATQFESFCVTLFLPVFTVNTAFLLFVLQMQHNFLTFVFTINTKNDNNYSVFTVNTNDAGGLMTKQNTFSIRLDDETKAMLNELDKMYREEADQFGMRSASKNQIINDAIKAYYSQRADQSGSHKNRYLDLMRDSVQQVVEPMMQGSIKLLKEQNEQIIDLAEQALMGMVKLSLQEKLSLYAQKCDTVSEEEIIGFLKSDYSYTSAINKYAMALINGEEV